MNQNTNVEGDGESNVINNAVHVHLPHELFRADKAPVLAQPLSSGYTHACARLVVAHFVVVALHVVGTRAGVLPDHCTLTAMTHAAWAVGQSVLTLLLALATPPRLIEHMGHPKMVGALAVSGWPLAVDFAAGMAGNDRGFCCLYSTALSVLLYFVLWSMDEAERRQ